MKLTENRKIIYILYAALILLFTTPVLVTDFSDDMTFYSLAGQKLNRGHVMYRDVVDSKPPHLYYTYAAVHRVCGDDSLHAVKILTMLVVLASVIMIGRVSKRLFPDLRPGIAELFLLAAMFSGFYRDFAATNAETYMNLFLIIGLWFVVKDGFRFTLPALFAAGLFTSIGMLYRAHGGINLAVFGLMILYTGYKRKELTRTLLNAAAITAGAAIPLAAWIIYFNNNGALYDFWFWALKYNFFYIQAGNESIKMTDSILKVGAVAGEQIIYLALAGSFFVYLVRKKVFNDTILFLLLLFIANLSTFFLGQRFYGHYFIQAIPPMILCCAALYSMFRPSGFFYHRAAHIALVLSLIFLIFNTWHAATRRNTVRSSQIVNYIKNLDSGSTVFYWSPSKRVMFYAGHSFATRFIQSNYQTGKLWGTIYRTKAATPEMTKKMKMKESWDMLMYDLEREKPDYIVEPAPEHNKFSSDKYPLLDNFIKTGYKRETVIEGYIVYKKKK